MGCRRAPRPACRKQKHAPSPPPRSLRDIRYHRRDRSATSGITAAIAPRHPASPPRSLRDIRYHRRDRSATSGITAAIAPRHPVSPPQSLRDIRYHRRDRFATPGIAAATSFTHQMRQSVKCVWRERALSAGFIDHIMCHRSDRMEFSGYPADPLRRLFFPSRFVTLP
jgi:hypothetical protein